MKGWDVAPILTGAVSENSLGVNTPFFLRIVASDGFFFDSVIEDRDGV